MGGDPMIARVCLTAEMTDWADAVGCRRRSDAVFMARRRLNGPIGGFDLVLEKDRLGARCELAGKVYFNPITWHWQTYRYGEPDLGDFIDIKGRAESWHDMPVQADGKPNFAYCLVYPDPHPEYVIHGWAWGHECMIPDYFEDKARSGRPCFYVPQEVLHDPETLLAEVRRRDPVTA
jgi:hypothetical protein